MAAAISFLVFAADIVGNVHSAQTTPDFEKSAPDFWIFMQLRVGSE
jgi:hypothetical protein